MKVLFDHQAFSNQDFGGVSRIYYELLRHFKINPVISAELCCKYSNNEYLDSLPDFTCHYFFKNFSFKGKARVQNLFNMLPSIAKIKSQDYDIFHPTYYNGYFIPFIGDKPFIITVYDNINEVYPEMFPLTSTIVQQKKIACERSSAIIAISNQTKSDLIRFYGIDPKKIHVVYLGNSLDTKLPISRPEFLPLKYLLYIGNRWTYKNFIQFITAAAPRLQKDRELHVICGGGSPFTSEENSLFKKLHVSEQIKHVKFSNDTELRSLYTYATFFCFPSLYEGFGIPILEAFACGCPVILSQTSCFPEIAGDAALYFDPQNKESLSYSINKLLDDAKVRQTLSIKGINRLKSFSWQRCADETLNVYRQLL